MSKSGTLLRISMKRAQNHQAQRHANKNYHETEKRDTTGKF